jgi:arabinan endo-1,5-alpha-L-arabinosidase
MGFRIFLSAATLLLVAARLVSQQPQALVLNGDYPITHDPSIGHEGNTYYVFATTARPTEGQFPIRCSTDLQAWRICGHVFDKIPDWIQQASPTTKALWAPDISYFQGKYHLYYAYSAFGVNTSGIALATNDTLDPGSPKYHWKDEGLVLKSTREDDFNAIDPNIVIDTKGQPWLSFGSFWGGIKMRRIDAGTGKTSSADMKLYSIEAPFIVRHGDYYYLFVSFDLCCRGTKSTYRTMVGRSKQVTGPYVDAQGKQMIEGGGTQLLGPNSRWLGPGGESVLQRPEGDILVFHAYDAITGKPALQISTLTWSDGWPHAALGTSGESK